MKKINVLFLAPNWRVSLIRAFQNSLGFSQFGELLAGADSNPYSPALKILNPNKVIPRFVDPACLEKLLTFCREESIDAIIPLTNRAIEFLNLNRKSFEDQQTKLYINETDTISICHDKQKLSDFFRKTGILTPDPINPEAPQFPLISKPRKGEGGKGCFVINNKQDLEYHKTKFQDSTIQRFIEGDEYTVDWFSDAEGFPLAVIPRKRIEVRAGEVTLSQIEMNPKIIEQVKKAGFILGLKGPCNIQGFKEASGRFLFTDINLRFGSGSVHSINQGADIPHLIYKEIAGEKLEFNPSKVQDGSIMSRFNDGFYF
jgi:carbamoyl-phosphate synthase large subunit